MTCSVCDYYPSPSCSRSDCPDREHIDARERRRVAQSIALESVYRVGDYVRVRASGWPCPEVVACIVENRGGGAVSVETCSFPRQPREGRGPRWGVMRADILGLADV